eukprot:83209-Pyramimonas_sp.AAC.1
MPGKRARVFPRPRNRSFGQRPRDRFRPRNWATALDAAMFVLGCIPRFLVSWVAWPSLLANVGVVLVAKPAG